VKIRLMGTPDECAAAVTAIKGADGLRVLEVSRPVRNRGDSRQVRVYIEARETRAGDMTGRIR
jgi:hypothetical protein